MVLRSCLAEDESKLVRPSADVMLGGSYSNDGLTGVNLGGSLGGRCDAASAFVCSGPPRETPILETFSTNSVRVGERLFLYLTRPMNVEKMQGHLPSAGATTNRLTLSQAAPERRLDLPGDHS